MSLLIVGIASLFSGVETTGLIGLDAKIMIFFGKMGEH
jgi:hypothetical protein